KLLSVRHPELSKSVIELIVNIADRVRKSPEMSAGLSVRATDEACIYLKHPLLETDQKGMLAEVLKSSFCGRYGGRWNDIASDAGAVWAIIQKTIKDHAKA